MCGSHNYMSEILLSKCLDGNSFVVLWVTRQFDSKSSLISLCDSQIKFFPLSSLCLALIIFYTLMKTCAFNEFSIEKILCMVDSALNFEIPKKR